MTRKSTRKASKKGSKKTAAKSVKTKVAYVVVRDFSGDMPSYSEPERIFGTKAAALQFAKKRNQELREICNPFDRVVVDDYLAGGEKALLALIKKLGLARPVKDKEYDFIDWGEWWDRSYFDMTDAQRAAIWDALVGYNWYKVKTTKVE